MDAMNSFFEFYLLRIKTYRQILSIKSYYCLHIFFNLVKILNLSKLLFARKLVNLDETIVLGGYLHTLILILLENLNFRQSLLIYLLKIFWRIAQIRLLLMVSLQLNS